MTFKKPEHGRIHPGDAFERAHVVRAFWKVQLEPIFGRSPDGRMKPTDRAEGSVMLRIDSPDADNCRRDIAFRAMAYGRALFILGIGKASQIRNVDGEEVKSDIELSVPSFPKNIMEYFMDIRKSIETQWSEMQGNLGQRMMSAQGIVSARFRFTISSAERMQMNLIQREEGDCDGKGKENCGSVRKLREAVE